MHGKEILEVRKALAFAGFTHKSPRPITYARIDKVWGGDAPTDGERERERERGRGTVRGEVTMKRGRAISM